MRLALVTLVAGTALAVPAAPSSAAECDGVPVVVDFASLGGGTQRGCAPGDPDSGVAALRAAGFEPTRAAQEAGYFVCRIDGKPANDPCRRASPANAYWSYWRGKPGGSWTFSNLGAAERDPDPGEVEGWAFGDGDPPSTPPPRAQRRTSPAAAAPPPASPAAPASRPTRAPVVAAPAPSTTPQPTASPRPGPSAASSSASSSATATARPTVSATTAGVTPTTAPSPEEVPLTVDDPDPVEEGGPLVGVLLALALVAALGAAAAWQAQRRR